MIDTKEILDIAIKLLKHNEYDRANKVIIDKMNEVLNYKTIANRQQIKEINKQIFTLNRIIDRYLFELNKIKKTLNGSAKLEPLEKSLDEIENKRKFLVNKKYGISLTRKNIM